MSRNFGLQKRPPVAGTDVLAALVFGAVMFAAGAGALIGAVYVQHKLRSWGIDV